MKLEIKQNNGANEGVFVALYNGRQVGLLTYTWIEKDKFTIDHTEVDSAYRGKGFGKELVYQAVEFAREKKLRIFPNCPFAKIIFHRNEDLRDVLS